MRTHKVTKEETSMFRDLLKTFFLQAVSESVLSGPYTDFKMPDAPAIFKEKNVVRLYMPDRTRLYFNLSIDRAFSQSEKNLIILIMDRLNEPRHASQEYLRHRQAECKEEDLEEPAFRMRENGQLILATQAEDYYQLA